ncbi:MAG: hypothetical protein ACTHL3_08155, partial [Candidatus Nitrosocosmicus sp.]
MELHQQQEQEQREYHEEEMNAYSIFVYGIRSPLTRDYYLRRLKIFFNYIELLPDKNIDERCNYFAEKGKENPQWAFNNIIKFLQFQKERVQKGDITSGTLKNFLK